LPQSGAHHSLEERVARLREQLRAGQLAAVLADVRTLLPDYPENRDLLLIEASALRHMLRLDEALAVLDRLAALQPHFSLMHQERGLCHVARRDAADAIEALLRAVNINPALPMAWRMLEGVYRLTGDAANAAVAAEHVATLAALPAEVVRATALFSDGDVVPAEEIVRRFLIEQGDHPEAMRLLAKIGIAHEAYEDAEMLLAGVLAMVPDHAAARFEYVQALARRHKFAEAEAELTPLLAADPASLDYRREMSTIMVGLGKQDRAVELYRGLLGELPESAATLEQASALAASRADLNLWLGHALKTLGYLPEAIAAYRAAVAARSDFGDAHWSLANLKTYRFDEAEIAAIRTALTAETTLDEDRVHLAFALGKACEDRADYEASWAAYAQGNAQRRATSRYRPEIFETNTREQVQICSGAFFEERSGWGDPSCDPIFVLGLPRSGSTLIEQILASHTAVEGTQELPQIQRYALELQGREPDLDSPRYPASLVGLTEAQCRALGERYLAETRVHRTVQPLFIDKMPNNFRHIGLIHLILPNATIIDARREPMACCFSNLKQLFAQGQEFSYSVEDIARYYRTYLDLMRHWSHALPGKVLRVCNEDVIEDLEGQVRRLLDHCDLPFEPACLSFHETRRAVRTPSSEQVRRPIAREGLDHWRAFEPWLAPLRNALGDAVNTWRD
jgi:tetratricopeptide (TPR) repeat protein